MYSINDNPNPEIKATATLSLPLGTILTVVFLILKLCGVIAWSWWWIFAPLWIPVGLSLIIILGILIFVGISCLINSCKDKKLKKKKRIK